MRAIGVTEYGGPEMLHEVDVPAETLGAGEVRVRVSKATVNPTDAGVRAGLRSGGDRPEGIADVPGMEVAGEVVEVGAGVEALAVGDRVMGIVVPSGTHGAYRDEVVLPAASVVPTPSGVSDAEAATVPMNGLTARLALDLLHLEPGQVLAVTGAAGALGGYVVQLAKADGLTVVADAAEKDEELVRSLGADVVVERGPGVAEAIRTHSLTASPVSSTPRSSRPRWCRRSRTVAGWSLSVAGTATVRPGCASSPCLCGRSPSAGTSSTPSGARRRRACSPSGWPRCCRPPRPPRPTVAWRRAACGGGWCSTSPDRRFPPAVGMNGGSTSVASCEQS